MGVMSTLPADPLTSTEWLLVDGTNLLHALSKAPVAAPRSALIGRLRGAVPATITIDVVFDGPAERGLRGERIANGMKVRYSGPRTADAVLLSLVEEYRVAHGPIDTASVLVVTDDRDLRHALRLRGARTAGAAWLLGRLARGTGGAAGGGAAAGRSRGSSIGAGRPRPTPSKGSIPSSSGGGPGGSASGSAGGPGEPEGPADDARSGWRAGRGATTKRGNPRRAPRPRSGC
jgi:predicted RNA-binding protein with PIN domain